MVNYVTISGIILNIIFSIFIIIVIIFIFSTKSQLSTCENDQSPFCLTIQCPSDTGSPPPCKGYAKRPGPNPNTYYCSYAPNTLVDENGNAI